jgi:hypothetical protein
LLTSGITGTYQAGPSWEFQPTAQIFSLWQSEDAYTDSLGTYQKARAFAAGRASTGIKGTYRWPLSANLTIAPYAGIYAEYHFDSDDASVTLLPAGKWQGWSARITSGVFLATDGNAGLILGGDLGGLGSGEAETWSLHGRATFKF